MTFLEAIPNIPRPTLAPLPCPASNETAAQNSVPRSGPLAILVIGAMNNPAARLVTDEVIEPMKSLFERLRSRRLASAFVLLATLSAAIVAGSFAAHGVRGQEKQNDSADATPLKVVNSTVPPNDFVRIARQVVRRW
jgi:hypothetical protein